MKLLERGQVLVLRNRKEVMITLTPAQDLHMKGGILTLMPEEFDEISVMLEIIIN